VDAATTTVAIIKKWNKFKNLIWKNGCVVTKESFGTSVACKWNSTRLMDLEVLPTNRTNFHEFHNPPIVIREYSCDSWAKKHSCFSLLLANN
jgi:hypothetical protein